MEYWETWVNEELPNCALCNVTCKDEADKMCEDCAFMITQPCDICNIIAGVTCKHMPEWVD